MKRCPILALALCIAAPLPGQQPGDPLPFTGCYRVTIGAWTQTAQGMGLVPLSEFRLDSTRVGGVAPAGSRFLVASDSGGPRTGAGVTATWRMLDGDSIEVSWSNHFSSGAFRLRLQGDSVSGRAISISDARVEPPAPDPVAPVTGSRVKCRVTSDSESGYRLPPEPRARVAPDFDADAPERFLRAVDPRSQVVLLDFFLLPEHRSTPAVPNQSFTLIGSTNDRLGALLAEVWQPFWRDKPDEMLDDPECRYPGRELARERRRNAFGGPDSLYG